MKKKILFLMEGIHDICIAKSIQEEIDIDCYSLIDTNDYLKKTFEEQDLINFKKCWYYRDILKQDSKYSMNYLRHFEEKYKIDLWKIAYSERIFYKYNKYHKFKKDEILSILQKNCKLFELILTEVDPDYVVTKLPDYNQSELFFQFCKSLKKPILMLNDTKLGFRYFISNNPDKIDNFKKLMKEVEPGTKTLLELREQIKQFSRMTEVIPKNFGTSSKRKFMASFRYLLKICNNNYRKYYVNFGRTRKKILLKETTQVLKKLFRQRFLEKSSITEIGQKSVYFALHFQPERSTLLAAPYQINQIEIIENIARSLPVEYTLYVKEHPIQIRYGWRETKYYKKIIEMPNVKLLHPKITNNEIFEKCELIFTVTGTSALEAAYYGKPAIIFGDTVFSSISTIFKIEKIAELSDTIKNALNSKIDLNELRQFTNCVMQNSFIHNDVEMAIKLQNEFFKGGYYYDYYISKKELHRFFEDNKKMFKNLGKQYAEKILQG